MPGFETTENEIRYRVKDPKGYSRFRYKKLAAGVNAVIGFKSGGGSEIQALRFNKKKFTTAQAKAWVKDHDFSKGLAEILVSFVEKREDVTPADKKRAKEEYGTEKFADPENEKYPIDTEEHIRAAWNYINKEKNAEKYSAADVKKIKGRIVAAWKEKIDKEGPPSAEMSHAITAKEFEMKPVKDFVVFRAGDYGDKGKYTEDDLDEMVESFTDPIPVILGHTSDYAVPTAIPKYGTIGGLKRIGKDLVATAVQMSDKLIDWVKEKFYEQRSIETYEDPTTGKNVLWRLGILGAAPPEVQGMDSLAKGMSAPGAVGVVSFSEVKGAKIKAVEFQAEMEPAEPPKPAEPEESLEEKAVADTIKNIEEDAATMVRDIEDHLSSEDEPDECMQEALNSVWEFSAGACEEIREHFAFVGKLGSIEEADEEDKMPAVEAMTKKIKAFINEFKAALLPGKPTVEKDMEKAELEKREKALLEGEKEFAKKLETARTETITARVKDFVAAQVKAGYSAKMLTEMKSEEALRAIVLSAPKEFQEGAKPIGEIEAVKEYMKMVPKAATGEAAPAGKAADNDLRPLLIQQAEKYAKDHKDSKEFEEYTPAQIVAIVLRDHANGKIKFEGE